MFSNTFFTNIGGMPSPIIDRTKAGFASNGRGQLSGRDITFMSSNKDNARASEYNTSPFSSVPI